MHRIEKKMEKSMKENCGKIENILNLALDATREEREKSLNLDVGYDVADDRKIFWNDRGTAAEAVGAFPGGTGSDWNL